uniref:Uncharacterized protein n=1 Tax=uncultured marine virus TaxID=186617 RepID=A0A0F7L630_9VIRU|nr:hypothetical protein [uncultured marine virus]
MRRGLRWPIGSGASMDNSDGLAWLAWVILSAFVLAGLAFAGIRWAFKQPDDEDKREKGHGYDDQ